IKIRQTDDAYVRFSKWEYDEHISWYLSNLESLDGVESGLHIVFLSKQRAGETVGCRSYNGFSADRWDSAKGCDEAGQIWIRDVEAYNRYMNDLSPAGREELAAMLIAQHSRVEQADIVLDTLDHSEERVSSVLEAFNLRRHCEIDEAELSVMYGNQRRNSKQRKGEDRRYWDNDGWYSANDTVVISRRLNDAKRAHPAFMTKESLKTYQIAEGIDLELSPAKVVAAIMRPFVESLVATQLQKRQAC
ncbi:hypothetical protein HDU78_002626, partial [Chytriomyces hyalinus]